MRFRVALKLLVGAAISLAWCAPALAAATRWETPVSVAHEVDNGTIAIDGAGAVTALFQTTSPKRVMISEAAPGGDFSDPVPFGPECSLVPQIVGNDRGDAIGVWGEFDWDPCTGHYPPAIGLRIRNAGGAFGPVRSIPSAGSPSIAMNPSGGAVLAWMGPPAGKTIKVASRLAGHDFGASTTLAGPGSDFPGAGCENVLPRVPQAAINARGDMVVVWSYWPYSWCPALKGGAFLSYRPAGGSWGKPEPLPGPGDSQAISLAPNGAVTIVFSRHPNKENDTAAIARSPDGDYSDVESLGARGDTRVTGNESGHALFWWVDGLGAVFQNYGAMQEPDGTLTRFKLLRAGFLMQLALDGTGNVLTAWTDAPSNDPPGSGQTVHAAMVNHLVLADSPETLAPEVSGGGLDNLMGAVVNDAGGAAVAYVENSDYSVSPPTTELRVFRRASDTAPPAVESPPAGVGPAAVTLEATCDEICRVRSSLTVKESSSGQLRAAASPKPIVALATRWLTRRRGRLARQTIGVGPKARKRIKDLQRAGVHLTAVAAVTAEDAWRNVRVVRRTVSLRKLLAG